MRYRTGRVRMEPADYEDDWPDREQPGEYITHPWLWFGAFVGAALAGLAILAVVLLGVMG